MDIGNASLVLQWIEKGKIKVEKTNTETPSPFAFNLITRAHADLLKMESKIEFLKRMHRAVLEKIK